MQKAFIVDRQFHQVAKKALEGLSKKILVIDINDTQAKLHTVEKIGELEYENFINEGNENYIWKKPQDEWQAIFIELYLGNDWKSKRCSLSS